jgi:excisionase family DNA binding protein
MELERRGYMKTYSIKEAAEILKNNEEWLRELIRRGKVKAVKVGRKWIVKEETINSILGADNGN